MPRTITNRNRKHPHNVMHEIGQKAYAKARQMSNAQLDEFLTEHVDNEETLGFIMTLNRSQKLQFIKAGAMTKFKKDFEAYQKQKKENKE